MNRTQEEKFKLLARELALDIKTGEDLSALSGAKFWLSILTELKNRGVEQILIACVDGLSGFPEAVEVVYPKARVQLCMT